MEKETTKTKTINGTNYTAVKMPAMIGTKLFFKLIKFLSPSLKGIEGLDLKDAEKTGLNMIAEALHEIDSDECFSMLDSVLTSGYVMQEVDIDGKSKIKEISSLDQIADGCPIEQINVFVFVCQFQFKESFAKLGKFKKLGALVQGLSKQTAQQE